MLLAITQHPGRARPVREVRRSRRPQSRSVTFYPSMWAVRAQQLFHITGKMRSITMPELSHYQLHEVQLVGLQVPTLANVAVANTCLLELSGFIPGAEHDPYKGTNSTVSRTEESPCIIVYQQKRCMWEPLINTSTVKFSS